MDSARHPDAYQSQLGRVPPSALRKAKALLLDDLDKTDDVLRCRDTGAHSAIRQGAAELDAIAVRRHYRDRAYTWFGDERSSVRHSLPPDDSE